MKITEDPVVVIGRLLAEAAALHRALDEKSTSVPDAEEKAHQQRFDAADDRVHALMDAMPAIPATSLVGALIQSRLLFCKINGSSGLGGRDRDNFQKLAASIVRVLECATSLPREAMAGDYFMPPRLDPFGPEPAFVAEPVEVEELPAFAEAAE